MQLGSGIEESLLAAIKQQHMNQNSSLSQVPNAAKGSQIEANGTSDRMGGKDHNKNSNSPLQTYSAVND